MKILTVGLLLATLALLPLAQAGDAKTSDKSKTTCADKASASACCADKTKVNVSAKTACTEKSACCTQDKSARKVANPDAKGATFLAKR